MNMYRMLFVLCTYLVAGSNGHGANVHDVIISNLGTHRSDYLSAHITDNVGRIELLVNNGLCEEWQFNINGQSEKL